MEIVLGGEFCILGLLCQRLILMSSSAIGAVASDLVSLGPAPLPIWQPARRSACC